MKIEEVIFAYGHRNIKATHKTTLEITKESKLTKRGNCIVAVSADKAMTDLSREFRDNILSQNAKVTISFEADGVTDEVKGFGSPKLILTHSTDIVIRKSDYVCPRTLAIRADKAACDISRKLVQKLMDPKQKVKITLSLESDNFSVDNHLPLVWRCFPHNP